VTSTAGSLAQTPVTGRLLSVPDRRVEDFIRSMNRLVVEDTGGCALGLGRRRKNLVTRAAGSGPLSARHRPPP
jgi:hypothetical protein